MFSLIFGTLLFVSEAVGMFESFEHYYNMSDIVRPIKPEAPLTWYPDVDVFIATYNEPVELVRKTVNGCVNMDYPDKKKVHIFICDDGRRPEMKALAEREGVGYIKRKDNVHAKAGNLNNALKHTTSPLVVTFDADMIPMHNFLMETVPYFYEDEVTIKKKIGFIQTPQVFYNPDLFQFNLHSENRIPDEQDYFYRDVQISRNKTNSVIYGGSNTVLSREALQKIGGFVTGVITEDFATGIEIQRQGYICYAIDTPLASGLSPSDIKSLINQRIRWARGCIQTGYKANILFSKGLTLKQRMSYAASILYWYNQLKRLIYIFAPILFSVFGIIVIKCTLLEVLIFWLPMYLLATFMLKRLSGNIRNTRWTNVYETVLFPYLVPSIIAGALGLKKRKFSVTKKDALKTKKIHSILYAIPHAILSALSIVGILNCVRYTFMTGSMVYIVILFWLINNMHTLIMSVFFMLGRNRKRMAERYKVSLHCTISMDGRKIEGITSDISESGFMIKLDFPHYIPSDKELEATLQGERLKTRFKCKVVSVSREGRAISAKYRYAFHITEIEYDEQNALFGIIYDRAPSLPDKLEDSISVFDDIVINISSRMPKQDYYNRKLVRVQVDRIMRSEECGEVKMLNFNYSYALFDSQGLSPEDVKLTIPVGRGMKLVCELVKEVNGNYLYKVLNYDETAGTDDFDAILGVWLKDWEQVQRDLMQKELAVRGGVKKSAENQFEFDEREYI
jgi:cellulose synthase (UDP-forming)